MDLSEAALGGRLKDLTRDDREVLLSAQRRLWIRDLSSGSTREVGWVNEGAGCWMKLDPTGGLVLSRNPRGVIGVASAHGGEPHLLLGQRGLGPAVVSPRPQSSRSYSPDRDPGSVVYQVGRAAEFSLPPSPETEGTQRFREWRLKVSVIYRLTDTEKLRDLLKKIFGS